MFIGRERELAFLEERYRSGRGELIILYGRRRVGKTETLCQFCKDKAHVFFTCTEVPDSQQLEKFSKTILATGVEASKYITRFADWEAALGSVGQIPGEGKKLLVIDEFPYMCKGNPSIPSILQKLWDLSLKNENIMIILCGSAMSFIEKELLAEKNPLYGRTTGIYKMNEMDFYDASKFFPGYSSQEKVAAYSILGGIPHYLLQFDGTLSIEENIKRNILTKGCTLYTETEFLLKQELRETAYYNILVSSIAMGNTTMHDITTKAGIESTKASAYLRNLMELGIVDREFPVSSKVKGTIPHGRGLYRLTDNFFRFWYAFVFPNYGELESGSVDNIYRYVISPGLPKYVSETFESVCGQFIRRIGNDGRLPFPVSKIGRWWGKRTARSAVTGRAETKTVEIDLLAEDFEKKYCLAGECKYTNEQVTPAVLEQLREKYPSPEGDMRVVYALFSKSGFRDSFQMHAEDVLLFDLEDIVKG